MTNKVQLNQDYIDGFFGNSGYLTEMSNAAIKRAISQLRKQWIASGEYKRGVDPTAQEIYNYVKH